MNEKYQAVKVSRSLQMTLSVIAVPQLIIQFSIENSIQSMYTRLKPFLAKKTVLFLLNLKEKTPEKLQSFQQQHR